MTTGAPAVLKNCVWIFVWKHCQRHNWPEGWVHLAKVTSWSHIKSSYTNLKFHLQNQLQNLNQEYYNSPLILMSPLYRQKKQENEGKIYRWALERWIKKRGTENMSCAYFLNRFSFIYRQLEQLLSNIDNLFTALSSCCDIIKQWASFTGIKFTKQVLVREWVTSIANRGQRESLFQLRDENENFSWSILHIETIREFFTLDIRLRDQDLLSSFSGYETRTRIFLIWFQFLRREREF